MQRDLFLKLMGNVCRLLFIRFWWVALSWEISILLPWKFLRHQGLVRTIFFFALGLNCHGNCHKYLYQTNINTPRCFLILCRWMLHKGRWRFVTMVQPGFIPLCPGPQTSTTATGAELGNKPALSWDTVVLHSPTCENLCAMAHFKRCASNPPAPVFFTHVFLHNYKPLYELHWDTSSCGHNYIKSLWLVEYLGENL